MRIWKQNICADTTVNKEGERGSTLETGIDIFLHPVMKIMVRQAVPLQPMEYPTVLQSAESPWSRRLLVGAVAHEQEPMWEQEFWQDLLTLQKAHAGAVCSWRTAVHGNNTHGAVTYWASCGRDPHWNREKAWEGISGRGKASPNELTPIPHLPAPLMGRRWVIQRQSLVSEEGWWEEGVFCFFLFLTFLVCD